MTKADTRKVCAGFARRARLKEEDPDWRGNEASPGSREAAVTVGELVFGASPDDRSQQSKSVDGLISSL